MKKDKEEEEYVSSVESRVTLPGSVNRREEEEELVAGKEAPHGQAQATALLFKSKVVQEGTAVGWDSGKGVCLMPIVT